MDIHSLIATIKYKLRYGTTVEWYNFWYVVLCKKQKIIPEVASIDETIAKIIKDRSSISRFGDGEILLTIPKAIRFQRADDVLASRLREVLLSEESNHLVCISDAFSHLERYNRKCIRFWRTHFYLYGYLWDEYLKKDKLYYNTFVTRPYMDFRYKEDSKRWFDSMKGIWKGRDVVFIEGEKSRLGVGNDLFKDASSIRRILCPSKNAFDRYDDILTTACKLENDVLFLIALGPTATVLAYDLYHKGYQSVDVGHVDIEYEWWRIGATRKVKLANKYVNESPTGANVALSAGDKYTSEIICSIL